MSSDGKTRLLSCSLGLLLVLPHVGHAQSRTAASSVSEPGCTPGTTQACGEDPQCLGTQVCQSDSTWGRCELPENGTVCDDNNQCTTDDVCSFGKCGGRGPVHAPTAWSDNNSCTTDTCDPLLGIIHTPRADGETCGSFDLCGGTLKCQSGECQAAVPLDCDDSNPCTDDTCSYPNGCAHTPKPDGEQLANGQTCQGGQATDIDCSLIKNPGPELCGDNQDNDCDGAIDEGFESVGQLCFMGLKNSACERVGTFVCTDDKLDTVCNVEAGKPTREICGNQIDEDCDGVAAAMNECGTCGTISADKKPGMPCGCHGTMECQSNGTTACVVGDAKFELCDGVDNDCDGSVDEGITEQSYSGPVGTVGIGICKAGTKTCVGGTLIFVDAAAHEVLPTPEICDGMDNNCNGQTDEGLQQLCYDGPVGTQGKGICGSGQQQCVAGAWGFCAGSALPEKEVCGDNVDNDCDGTIDEQCGGSTSVDTGLANNDGGDDGGSGGDDAGGGKAVSPGDGTGGDEGGTSDGSADDAVNGGMSDQQLAAACTSEILECQGKGFFDGDITQLTTMSLSGDGQSVLLFGRHGKGRMVKAVALSALMGDAVPSSLLCELSEDIAFDVVSMSDDESRAMMFADGELFVAGTQSPVKSTDDSTTCTMVVSEPMKLAICDGDRAIGAIDQSYDLNSDGHKDLLVAGYCMASVDDVDGSHTVWVDVRLTDGKGGYVGVSIPNVIELANVPSNTHIEIKAQMNQQYLNVRLMFDVFMPNIDGAPTMKTMQYADCNVAVQGGQMQAEASCTTKVVDNMVVPMGQIMWRKHGPQKITKEQQAGELLRISGNGTMCKDVEATTESAPIDCHGTKGEINDAHMAVGAFLESKVDGQWRQNVIFGLDNGLRMGRIVVKDGTPSIELVPQTEEFIVASPETMTWTGVLPVGAKLKRPSIRGGNWDGYGGDDLLVSYLVDDAKGQSQGVGLAFYHNNNEQPHVTMSHDTQAAASESSEGVWHFSITANDPTDDALTHTWQAIDANGNDVSHMLNTTQGLNVTFTVPKPTSRRWELIRSAHAEEASNFDLSEVTVTVTSCDDGNSCAVAKAVINFKGEVELMQPANPLGKASGLEGTAAEDKATVSSGAKAPTAAKKGLPALESGSSKGTDDFSMFGMTGGCSLVLH
jgi:hypothetical protein